jgi:hypothetical protein
MLAGATVAGITGYTRLAAGIPGEVSCGMCAG